MNKTVTRHFIITMLIIALMMMLLCMPLITIAKTYSGSSGMIIQDSKGMPILRYSDPTASDYSNDNSDILRFCVYVETDYDTDLDGKADLVKALVQVPRAAASGESRVPVIYEASPYIAGTNYGDLIYKKEDMVSDKQLMNRPNKREVSSYSDTLTQASKAVQSDFYYTFDSEDIEEPNMFYSNLTEYDELLINGYAVVLSAGIGTYQSEGIECCGTVMERDAFIAVAEWLHGDRVAYTDKENNIAIKADWSNGRIGMIGFSYSAAMAYEVAASGTKGVETIVASSGPYSWYDYSNSQGLSTYIKQEYDYNNSLATYCSSRFFKDYTQEMKDMVCRHLGYVRTAQSELRGSYGPFWADRDFSNPSDFRASVLFIQGLNDNNVTTKHMDLVRSKLINNGCDVKTILHQNNHQLLWDSVNNTQIMIGQYSYSDWLNMWFNHYLRDVDNSVNTMPSISVQSNIDGTFIGTDDWDSGNNICLYPNKADLKTINPKDACVNDRELYDNTFVGMSLESSDLWTADVNSPITINGKIPLHIRVKADYNEDIDLPLYAYLIDYCDTPYMAYDPDKTPLTGEVRPADTVNSKSIVEYNKSQTNRKIISKGCINLNNPNAGYEPYTASKSMAGINSGEYYDYTIYLTPNYYTVEAGHKLELYIVPFGGLEKIRLYSDDYTEQDMRDMGMDPNDYTKLSRNYMITVDDRVSFAQLPVTKESNNSNGHSSDDNSRGGVLSQTISVKAPKTGDNRRLLSLLERKYR